jgi:F-type H+-transporting ATPase subunit epsilon
MSNTMTLEVITPEKPVYKGEVVLVQLPGAMGSFEIMHNHAPLMAILEKGRLKVIDEERNKFFIDIESGVVEVRNNHIIVITP